MAHAGIGATSALVLGQILPGVSVWQIFITRVSACTAQHWLERQTGWSIKKFVSPPHRHHTVQIRADTPLIRR